MASTVVLVVVFVFDLIAFSLAVAAEQRKSSARLEQNGDYTYCVYEKDVATGLGVGAFLFLFASQFLITSVTRCICMWKHRPGRYKTLSIVLFITCWVFFSIAMSCLLNGAVKNAHYTKYRRGLSCKVVRKGLFAAGAVFVVLTGIVSELFYVCHSKAADEQGSYGRNSGVRMGNL